MGRVNDQAPAASPPTTPLMHFSHPHELHPLSVYNPQTLCSGCKLQSSGIMFTCIPCSFTLHQSCADLHKLITHPSHGTCILSLLTLSSYPGGVFSCNACGHIGDSWNYHCSRCEYDLHVICALKPLKIRHQAHNSCELELTFKNPYANANGFSCDICRKMGSKQWLYRCNSCEFDVHLDCAASPLARSLQHNQLMHSFSGPSQAAPLQPHLVHSASTGSIGYPYGGVSYPYQVPVNPGNQGMVMDNGIMGRVQNNQRPMGSGLGGNMLNSALQGLVGGAFQSVGQTIMQDAIGGGSGNGGGGGGEGVGGQDGYSY